MGFSEGQLKLLSGKLNEKHVRTREEKGHTLSYIEGWFAIEEANRIFGFDGWDRETVWADCVWSDARSSPRACAYAVRVRIRVRAGEAVICRDGSGVGHGVGATLGEAHESALKEAETDATKRALTTFGNLFGLALYGQHPQDSLLGHRAALDLLGQQPPDRPENVAGPRLLEKGADVAREEFADALAGHLERQAIAPELGDKLDPLRAGPFQVLGCQQRLDLVDSQTTQLERAHRLTQHCQVRRGLAAGQEEAALMLGSGDNLEHATVARQAVPVRVLVLAWLEQRLEVVQRQQTAPLPQQPQ